jgi:type II secretory pathway pseudopilin PulG
MEEFKELFREAWKQGYKESKEGIYDNDGTFEDWFLQQMKKFNTRIRVCPICSIEHNSNTGWCEECKKKYDALNIKDNK